MKYLLHSFVFLSVLLSVRAAEFFVAPNGTSSGDGSVARPWNLQTAFNHPPSVRPGDTIWLRGGTYGSGGSSLFECRLTGALNLPITVREYTGEHARVDGGINARNGFVTFWGFEIMNSNPGRKVQNADRPGGLNMYGQANKAINLIVHDTGHPGLGFWNAVGDTGEIYGCLIWGNGLYDLSDPRFPDGWTRGSAIYTQNQIGTRYITDIIAFRNFTTGVNAYTQGGYTDGYDVEGSACFDHPQWNFWFTGGDNPQRRLKLVNSYAYQRNTDSATCTGFGYQDFPERDVLIQNNYIVAGMGTAVDINNYADVKMSGNTIIGRGRYLGWNKSTATSAANVDNNTYAGPNTLPFVVDKSVGYNLTQWKALNGLDAHSTASSALPTANRVFIRPNKYEPSRAHIIVYNWAAQSSMAVDLSTTGLKSGDRFEIRDSQNYYGTPVFTGTYSGAPVTLPLNLTQISPVIGSITHFNTSHTPSDFNAFVVLPLSGSTGGNTAPTISTIADVTTTLGLSIPTIPFTIGDIETVATSLAVSASSSNQGLISDANIVLGGLGANRTILLQPTLNQSGASTITVTVSDGSLMTTRTFALRINAINTGPTISAIADQTVVQGIALAAIPFTIGDAATAATSLTVSASSSNQGLISDANIVLGGLGANRTILLQPTLNQSGASTITVTVSDGSLMTTRTFALRINAINTGPTISAIADQTVVQGIALAAIPFTIGDAQSSAASLTVTASSSNKTLVPDSGIALGGTGGSRTVTVTPAANQTGTATITVSVSDGVAGASETFILTVKSVIVAPAVSNVAATFLTISSALITWTTSVPADSQVQFGPTTAYGQMSSPNSQLVTSHQVTLNTLSPATLYNFRVQSRDALGTLATSPNATFTTRPLQTGTKTNYTIPADAGTLVAPMALATDATNPQIKYVTSPVAEQGTTTYNFSVTESDNYIIWCRVLALSPAQDSFYVSMDGGADDVYDDAEGTWSANWQWTALNGRDGGNPLSLNPRVFTLSPGSHKLAFRTRDANSALQRIIITNDPDFVPADTQPPPPPVNTAPTISPIAGQTINEDTATGALSFTVGDAETAAGSLTVTASTSNTLLVPNANLILGGSGANRTLTVTPAANQSGTVVLTVLVSDGSATSSTSFDLRVNPVNDAPTISGIADQTVPQNTPTATLPFTVADRETPAANLTVFGSSLSKSLVPDANIAFGGSGTSRTVTITPAAGQSGSTIITITINDGTTTASQSFLLTVTSGNKAPVVDAGPDETVNLTDVAHLAGTASDDGLPNPPSNLTTTWSQFSGPGIVTFENANALATTANFTLTGSYKLRLTAHDGALSSYSELAVTVVEATLALSDVGASIVTSSNAVISWTTSVASDSQVKYGTNSSSERTTFLDSQMVTTHRVVLSNLIARTEYRFRVLSKDATGTLVTSDEISFFTRNSTRDFFIPLAAESGKVGDPMVVRTVSTDPKQKYVFSSSGNRGTASYTFYVPEAADYIVWCRVLASSSSRNSFFVSVDGASEDIYDCVENAWSDTWKWDRLNGRAGANPLTLNPRKFSLAAGKHTLVFRGKEKNTYLNRMIVTTDRDFVPSDNQPVQGIATALTLSNMVIRLSIGPGYSMIANQLDRGNNTLGEVLKSVPEETRLLKYNSENSTFEQSTFLSGSWSNASQTLSPGEGAFVHNPSGAPVNLVFTGQLRPNNPPIQSSAGLHLISSPYPYTGNISMILDATLPDGTTCYQYNNLTASYIIRSYNNGTWDTEPFIKTGESFYLYSPPTTPLLQSGDNSGSLTPVVPSGLPK